MGRGGGETRREIIDEGRGRCRGGGGHNAESLRVGAGAPRSHRRRDHNTTERISGEINTETGRLAPVEAARIVPAFFSRFIHFSSGSPRLSSSTLVGAFVSPISHVSSRAREKRPMRALGGVQWRPLERDFRKLHYIEC